MTAIRFRLPTGPEFDKLLRDRGLGHVLELLELGRNQPGVVAVAPTYTQKSFRGRNDDGSEAAATWIAAENANWSQATAATFRLRFEVEVTSFTGGSQSYVIQSNKNSAGWVTVTTSTANVKLVASGTVADDAVTTNQLTTATSTFIAGRFDSNGTVSAVTITANAHSEFEYCLQIVDADVANGDTIQFRVSRTGTALTTYSQTPTVTVSKGGGSTVAFAATVAGVAAVAAAAKATRPIAAAAAGVATVAAALKPTRKLTATTSGTAVVAAALRATRALTATSAGAATVTASQLTDSRALTSTVAGQATVTAALRATRPLTATSNGTATVTAAFPAGTPALAATVTGIGTVTADLHTPPFLHATTTGTGVVAAVYLISREPVPPEQDDPNQPYWTHAQGF